MQYPSPQISYCNEYLRFPHITPESFLVVGLEGDWCEKLQQSSPGTRCGSIYLNFFTLLAPGSSFCSFSYYLPSRPTIKGWKFSKTKESICFAYSWTTFNLCYFWHPTAFGVTLMKKITLSLHGTLMLKEPTSLCHFEALFSVNYFLSYSLSICCLAIQ